ncbi:MAG: hypothetical protein IPM92_10245 [Saprospiraceae bacterium]|nr:hypothetical protein [Saprospiraceae bacterium]
MKAFMIKSACLFSAFAMVTLSSGISAQGTPTKTNVASATADYTKVTPTTKKGEVTRETDCIDLFVNKGCVKYSVSVPGEN